MKLPNSGLSPITAKFASAKQQLFRQKNKRLRSGWKAHSKDSLEHHRIYILKIIQIFLHSGLEVIFKPHPCQHTHFRNNESCAPDHDT